MGLNKEERAYLIRENLTVQPSMRWVILGFIVTVIVLIAICIGVS